MNLKQKSIAVIGAGLSGLVSSTLLAKDGKKVVLMEKNEHSGGRVRQFQSDGFIFDMGPSWYWMPDVIERYFKLFDHTSSDFFDLKRLDPGFRVYFSEDDKIDIPDSKNELMALFESIEPGSSAHLEKFLSESKLKYEVGVKDLVYKPSDSITEFLSPKLALDMLRLKALTPFNKYVRSYFKDERLIKLMEFPILFLGGTAQSTPSLYSLMNYACFELGTWYPQGGFGKLADAFTRLAHENGVEMMFSSAVDNVRITDKRVNSIVTDGMEHKVDGLINSGDYHHFEKQLISDNQRTYSEKYWETRTMSPSSLIFYLGVNKRIDGLLHHNLFFDKDFDIHAKEIYNIPQWPSDPLFYVCCPSKTDDSVAPDGMENLFILMPLAVGIEDSEDLRNKYYNIIMDRLKHILGIDIRPDVIFKKSFCLKDFKNDYNSYKGNAYGLANTTLQTAFLKPKMKSKKIKNLFHCGQLTVPGPGVPPSIISGEVAANQMISYLNKN
ncbi:MAG: phytoene desaturase [Cyclobacteriaceae bacterium]